LGYDGHNLKGRKINIELSAGGGGNNPTRLAKIDKKRQSLAKEKITRFGLDYDKKN